MTPRVLAIIDSIKLGGPGRGLIQLCERAERQAVHVELANFQYAKDPDSEFIREVGRRKIELNLLRQKHRLDSAPVKQVLDIVKSHEINIIQSHGYKSHLVALAASRRSNLPWVSVNHGWTNEDCKVRLYNAIERFLIRFSDKSVVVSQKLFDELSRLRATGNPPVLISNAIDASQIEFTGGDSIRAKFDIPETDVLLGVIGRLSHEKGQDLALRALDRIRKIIDTRCHLLFVGSGPMRQELSDLADELGLQDLVHFAGHQTRIGAYYDAIDMLVLPSRSEGLPNVVLEAFALKVPVVATDVGDVARLVRNGSTGWLAEAVSDSGLCSALSTAITDRDIWNEIVANAESSLHPEFCPMRRTEKFSELYKSITAN